MDKDLGQTTAETLRRVQDLWLPQDANVVVWAGRTVFQVSGAVLGAKSPVLRKMLACVGPTAPGYEEMDGSPVVRLQDSAHDVEVLLRAVFDSSYFMPSPAPTHLGTVLVIARMSTKYEIRYLRLRALKHLKDDGWYIPTFFAEGTEHLLSFPPSLSPVNPLAVIAAAKEVGAVWLLPFAYYCLGTFYPVQLAPLLKGNAEEQRIVERVMEAQTSILRGTMMVNRFLTDRSSCDNAAECNRVRTAHLADLLNEIESGRGMTPRTDWTGRDMEGLLEDGMCGECYSRALREHGEASERFWQDLPAVFDLPPWPVLARMMHQETAEA